MGMNVYEKRLNNLRLVRDITLMGNNYEEP